MEVVCSWVGLGSEFNEIFCFFVQVVWEILQGCFFLIVGGDGSGVVVVVGVLMVVDEDNEGDEEVIKFVDFEYFIDVEDEEQMVGDDCMIWQVCYMLSNR